MKRFLTSLLALVFLLSSASIALAAPLDTDDEEGVGAGSVVTIEPVDRIKVTLPTSEGFKFSIDPHGIFHMDNADIEKLTVGDDGIRLGKKADVPCTANCENSHSGTAGDDPCTFVEGGGAWAPLPNAGQVVFTEGYAPLALNESNFDVAFSIDFQIVETDSATPTPATTTKITPVASAAAAAAGLPAVLVCTQDECENDCNGDTSTGPCDLADAIEDANTLFIAAVFSTANVTNKDATSFSGTLGLPITKTEKSPVFLLEEMPYSDKVTVLGTGDDRVVTIEQKSVKDAADGIGNGTQFMLFGRCNPIADWNILSKADAPADITKLSITVGYTIEDAEDVDYGAVISGAAGLRETDALEAGDFIAQTLSASFDEEDDDPVYGFLNGAAAFTTFTNPTALVALTISGLDEMPFNITAITMESASGTFSFIKGPSTTTTTHYNYFNDLLYFHAGKAWPGLATSDELHITIVRTEGATPEIITVSGLTLGS